MVRHRAIWSTIVGDQTPLIFTFWIDSTDNFGVSSKILVPNGVQLHNRFFWQKKILALWDPGDEVFFRVTGKWSLTRTEVGWVLRCFRNLTFVKHEVWNHISTLTQSNFSRFGYLNLLRWRRKSWYRRILSSGSFCLIGGKSLRRRLVSRSDTFMKNVHFSGSFWALARTPVELSSMLRCHMKAEAILRISLELLLGLS